MKKVVLDFHHKEFEDLSDRSIRQFMRKVATAVRHAQLRQLNSFIFAQDVDYSVKRSIADRLKNASRDAPAFYVEKIEKGSLTAVFTVGAVILAALVREPAIDLVDDEARRRTLLKNLKRYVKRDWAPDLAQALADQLEGSELGSHVVADRVRVKEKTLKFIVEVKLITERDEDDAPRPAETLETVERAISQRLEDLDRDGM
ncbi:hypothetical protein [Sphingomonas sp. PAMC 26617]|uniref:hypothetical protein n=1 Tax=Sphingomonas sp. PAMC 26617 TaxID=1112216 RepID=UPI0002890496|nr:hypothetical protein [Sphingomonas sp. PAMC 26617]